MRHRSRPSWKACKNKLLRKNWPITTLESNKSQAWLFVTQLGFQTLGHLERVIPHGLDIQRDLKREKVLKRLQAHAVGDQGRPLRFHIQQLRGDRLGEQRG